MDEEEFDFVVRNVLQEFCGYIGVTYNEANVVRFQGTYAQKYARDGGSIVFVFVRDTVFAKIHVRGRFLHGEMRTQWDRGNAKQAVEFMRRAYGQYDEWKNVL